MLGYDSKEDLFNTVNDIDTQLFVNPERRKELVRIITYSEIVHNFEYQVYTKEGEVIWLNENTRAEKDESGKILYLEGSAEVVTTRKNAEEHIINLTHSYHRFVPASLVNLIQKDSITDMDLHDYQEINASIMFSDIYNFTNLSESMTPEECFKFLNSYTSKIAPIIRRYNGVIDKYIGDCIMAIFRSPTDAVMCGIDMLDTLVDYNAGRKRAKYEPINIGIGINTGDVAVGVIGEPHRLQGTVIGDVVNTSARIESLTRELKANFLISESTFNELNLLQKRKFSFAVSTPVKGKDTEVQVYKYKKTAE